MVVFRAMKNGELLGAHLWYQQQNVVYSHLAASTERGYKLNCSYAIHSAVVEYFRSKVQWIDLGAGAGTAAQSGWTKPLQGRLVEQHSACIFLRADSES